MDTGDAWKIHDNLFDTVTLTAGTPVVQNSHNGYLNTTQLPNSSGGNQTITTRDYQSGPLGTNYYPSVSGPGFYNLIGAGSRPATTAGLSHYTTTGSKDQGQVDIGFHSVALGDQSKLTDVDSDGIPDIYEDINGDSIAGTGETDFAYADSDYDGVNDGDELYVDGTSPLDPNDGSNYSLGAWRFDAPSFIGEQGQLPLTPAVAQQVSSWSGSAAKIEQTSSILRYREIEANAFPNINARRGTVRFWIRTSWPSGFGPSAGAPLLELGSTANFTDGWWALSFGPNGGSLLLESQVGSTRHTYLNQAISWQPTWHHVAITYGATETKLYIDGQLAQTGSGIQSFPNTTARAQGFTVGSNHAASEQAQARFENLETFNYVLLGDQITSDYDATRTIDSDFDGLNDIAEDEAGTDLTKADTDGDGLTDGQELNTYNTDPLDADPDYDGRSDREEVLLDAKNPYDATSVVKTNLARFRFNVTDLSGERDQLPREAANITSMDSWSGRSARIAGTQPARLNYSDIEADGSANINCREGSIRFWFKPSWSSGTGPGHAARLIEIGDKAAPTSEWWALSVDATGSVMQFDIFNEAQGDFPMVYAPITFTANTWYLVTVTYDQQIGRIYINDQVVADAFGTIFYPGRETRALTGFSVGSNRAGAEQAEGEFDDLETFNYVLTASDVAGEYTRRISVSSHTAYVPAHVNVSTVVVNVEGAPNSQMAVLVNSTDFAGATWVPVSSVTLNLNAPNGINDIWIGFRDVNNEVTWQRYRVIVDTVPPVITVVEPQILDPEGTIVPLPLIQLKGYADEQIQSVSYTIVNSVETRTDSGFVIKTETDPTVRIWFQCFDIQLAPGQNTITLEIVDLAGNVTTSEIIYICDLTGVTAGPTILSRWPLNGMTLSGSMFTVRGYLDDPTATVTASVTGGGVTTPAEGIVERDGLFWVEDLPLAAGANEVTLTARNAAGFDTVSMFSVTGGSFPITINPISGSLHRHFVLASGTIGQADYTIWVNGIRATIEDGSWSAEQVPLNGGGTATFDITAIPNTDNGGNGEGGDPNAPPSNVSSGNPASANAQHLKVDLEKPAEVRIKSYSGSVTEIMDWDPCDPLTPDTPVTRNEAITWVSGAGGRETRLWAAVECEGEPPNQQYVPSDGGTEVEWDPQDTARYRVKENGDWGEWNHGSASTYGPPLSPWEFCQVGPLNRSWDPLEPVLYTRSGQTRVELLTGGKGVAGRQNLFTIIGKAWDILPLDTSRDGEPTSMIPIRPVQLQGIGVLIAERKYLTLPDGLAMEITPTMPDRAHYRFDIAPFKHKLILAANDALLNEDGVAPNAKFCVGKKIKLLSALSPPVFPAPTIDVSKWTIDGTFINKIVGRTQTYTTPSPSKSPEYLLDPFLLYQPGKFQPNTTVWWITGGDKSVRCSWVGLTFANGNRVGSYSATGFVNVHRPTLSGFRFNPTRSFMILTTLGRNELSYGDEIADINGMKWWVTVNSQFNGVVAVTQLIDGRYTIKTTLGTHRDVRNTNDKEWLDAGEFYSTWAYAVSNPASHEFPFHDYPGLEPLTAETYMRGNFRYYIRFRPDVGQHSEDIFVTLGIGRWEMMGLSEWQTLITNVTPPPDPPVDSIAFPEWDKIWVPPSP